MNYVWNFMYESAILIFISVYGYNNDLLSFSFDIYGIFMFSLFIFSIFSYICKLSEIYQQYESCELDYY